MSVLGSGLSTVVSSDALFVTNFSDFVVDLVMYVKNTHSKKLNKKVGKKVEQTNNKRKKVGKKERRKKERKKK